ncbi:MAG: glutathione peroxidase [Clostridia bacterium]|nr:glutathione peroxidase [Clostridia bacterium]
MSLYALKVTKRGGEETDLSSYKGKVLLIVNTATRCGFTKQYSELEELYEKYHDKGLEILDFPCNQFLHQAPGTDEEIHEFCTLKFNTKFDQFSKIEVNGKNEHPLYAYLKAQPKGEGKRIRWNFTKFLVDRNGEVVARYDSKITPSEIAPDIEKLL